MRSFVFASALASLGMSVAGAANAAHVEVWDVLAPYAGCCAGNPSYDDQKTDRSFGAVNLGENTVLVPAGGESGSVGGLGSYFDNGGQAIAAPYTAVDVEDVLASGTAADVSFDIAGLGILGGFASGDVTSTSILGFFDNPTENLVDNGAGANDILGSVVRITGFVDMANGDMFQVTSDDGYRITIGGTTILPARDNLQAPSSILHTYTGATGTDLAFEMVWFEANVSQAALDIDLPRGIRTTPVPVPAAGFLLIGALGGLGFAARRRKAA